MGIADEPALSGLLAGHAPVHEPGLDVLLDQMIKAGRLHFTKSYLEGLRRLTSPSFPLTRQSVTMTTRTSGQSGVQWTRLQRQAKMALRGCYRSGTCGHFGTDCEKDSVAA